MRTLWAATVFTLPRMNWLAQRKTLKLALILALLAGAVTAYVARQPDELTRYKAQLAARGEELSLPKLLPPCSEEAVEYHRLLGDAAARLVFSPIPPAEINLMARTTNGFAHTAWTQPKPASTVEGTWEDFARQMESLKPALTELRRLLTSPVLGATYDPADPFRVVSKFDFVSRRKTAQTLAAAVVNELHGQRLGGALTNLDALLGLARLNDEGGMLVDHMIHAAIGGLAVSATWECLQAPGWTDAHLASLQSAWQPMDFLRGLERTAEIERAFAVVFYSGFRTNADLRMSFGYGGGGQRFHEALFENLHLAIWATAWSKGDELRFLETMQALLEGVRHEVTNRNYKALRSSVAEAVRAIKTPRSSLDRLRRPVASMFVPNWEKAVTSLVRHETQRQMALTAIALKRYQLKHGRLPAELASLTPGFLASPPVDYLNGGRIQYQRISDQRFTLRSTNPNSADSGASRDELIWPAPEIDTLTAPQPQP
jgi:predicted NAD-dependent protein-ADP-ribosyltransferase YbiA (DUF1768 family)